MKKYFCKQQLDEEHTCLINRCSCKYGSFEEAKQKCIPFEPLEMAKNKNYCPSLMGNESCLLLNLGEGLPEGHLTKICTGDYSFCHIYQSRHAQSLGKCKPTLNLASSGEDPYQGLTLEQLKQRADFEAESG